METFVAFLAVVVASITFFLQRQHNRKSLQPILNTHFHHGGNNGKGELVLFLDNYGLGPCLITGMTLCLGGNKYKIEDLRNYENAFFKEGFFCRIKDRATISCIKPLDRVVLLRLEVDNVAQAARQLEHLGADFRIDGLSQYQQHVWCDKDGAHSEDLYPAEMRGQAYARRLATQSLDVRDFAAGFLKNIVKEFRRSKSNNVEK